MRPAGCRGRHGAAMVSLGVLRAPRVDLVPSCGCGRVGRQGLQVAGPRTRPAHLRSRQGGFCGAAGLGGRSWRREHQTIPIPCAMLDAARFGMGSLQLLSMQPEFCRTRANSGRQRPELAQSGPKAEIGFVSAEVGRRRAKKECMSRGQKVCVSERRALVWALAGQGHAPRGCARRGSRPGCQGLAASRHPAVRKMKSS